MKLSVSVWLFVGLSGVSLSSQAQEVAGRLAVAVGEVSIVRGAQTMAATAGSEVRSGDTVQLGPQSNAQILFTDQSVVALRPNTLFRVTEYSFQSREPETGRAFYSLLKGGLRTVTGLIGRRNHANYSVGTPVATVGIRGTHYSLVHCDNNCSNSNGSLAPNGTYGGVTDGRIGVVNQSGEHVFGSDQSFHVASIASAPQQLIAPPGFLRDKLEGRSRSSSKETTAASGGAQQSQQQGQQQQGAVAPTGKDGGTGDTRVSSSTATVTAPILSIANAFQANNSATTSSQGLANVFQQSFGGTIFYRIGGAINLLASSCSSPPCGTITLGEITLAVNYAAGRATVGVNAQFSPGGDVINYGTPATLGGIPVTITGNQATFGATLLRTDFPLSNGAFRCSACGPGGTVGFADTLTISGSITGGTANLILSATEPTGSGSLTVSLPQATPPNSSSAALAVKNFAGGNNGRSASYWNVGLDAAGRLLSFGPIVGQVSASVGTATNNIIGASPADGNLVWGKWGAGSNLTDFNYVTGSNPQVAPWITGDAVNNIPPSLGTQTFTLIPGAVVFRNGGDVMNSASLVADFVNRTVNVSLNATSGANTFQMNGAGGIAPTSGRFSQAFNSVTCTGPCPGGATGGNYGGFFAGAQAQAVGIAFTGGNGVIGVTGVAGLRR